LACEGWGADLVTELLHHGIEPVAPTRERTANTVTTTHIHITHMRHDTWHSHTDTPVTIPLGLGDCTGPAAASAALFKHRGYVSQILQPSH
jgi:hypothetical protein